MLIWCLSGNTMVLMKLKFYFRGCRYSFFLDNSDRGYIHQGVKNEGNV